MKRILIMILAGLLSMSFFAQQKTWKEMQDFHDVMSSTIHPLMSGNIQPLKTNSTSLLDKAKRWQSSSIPSGYDTTGLKSKLDVLVNECGLIDQAVKAKQTNKQLKSLATKAHNTFHNILDTYKIEGAEH